MIKALQPLFLEMKVDFNSTVKKYEHVSLSVPER